MRIFSKHALIFNHPEDRLIKFQIASQAFADAPDWIEKSDMFQLATKGEVLSVITSADQASRVEQEPVKVKSRAKSEGEKVEGE